MFRYLVPCAAFLVVVVPQYAMSTEVRSFEDWRVTCSVQELDDCRVWQRIQVLQESEAHDVLAVSLAPADDGLTLIVQTPLDVYLPADFALRIDGQDERRVRFRHCNPAGCWVLIPADGNLLRAFQRGQEAEAALSLVEGQTVRISFSLMGFTAALNAFREERASDD